MNNVWVRSERVVPCDGAFITFCRSRNPWAEDVGAKVPRSSMSEHAARHKQVNNPQSFFIVVDLRLNNIQSKCAGFLCPLEMGDII